MFQCNYAFGCKETNFKAKYIMDTLLPMGVKLTAKKNLVRDSGIQVSSTEYSQYHDISQISSSEDMF